MKVLVTGGTGFVGTALVEALVARGDVVTVFSRGAAGPRGATVASWTPESRGPWMDQVAGHDAVVHLAGKPIAEGRWSAEHLAACARSRTVPTALLAEAIAAARSRGEGPQVLVGASAVGYYGTDRGNERLPESAPPGTDTLAHMCVEWEGASAAAQEAGCRVALARIGIVLDRDGGALGKMLPPFRLGVGGPLGHGAQPFPWVHRADVVGALVHALDHSALAGPFNLVAPNVVTMDGFARALGAALGRPSFFRVPSFALRLAVGDFADVLLTGQDAPPERLLASGYRFQFDRLEEALGDILRRRPAA